MEPQNFFHLDAFKHHQMHILTETIYNIYLDHRNLSFRNPMTFYFYTSLLLLISLVYFLCFFFAKIRKKVSILPDNSKPRFRKRDKVMFFGRKMLRKVRSSIQGNEKPRGKKRQMVLKFAKKLLQIKKEIQPLELKVKEPSQAFLKEDLYDSDLHDLPDELIYMVKSIRVFGFFEKPLFLRLCQKIEIINLIQGEFLFNIGDSDNSIYIVKTGEIKVFLTETDGSMLTLKNVHPGESIASMLSVMDFLSGYPSHFKTVSASAVKDSQILRLKMSVLKRIVDEYPEMLVRVVQIIMVRLQRVTFTSLYKYLGLTTQLVNAGIPNPKRSFINVNANLMKKSSPSHSINRKSHHRSYSNADAIELSELIRMDVDKSHEIHHPQNQQQTNHFQSTTSSPKFTSKQNFIQDDRSRFIMKRKKSVLGDDRTAGMSYDEIVNMAVNDLKIILNLEDGTLLKKYIQIKEFLRDVCLASEETHDENNLIFLISGSITVSQKLIDTDEENYLYSVYPGELIGALDVLTGEESIFTVKTKQNCKVAVVSKENSYKIMSKHPEVVLSLAHTVIQRLSTFVRQIDFALDWVHYDSGRAIYRNGAQSDCTYIVLSGRLRSVITQPNGKLQLVGEYGKGDLVGIVELVTQTPRSSTVIAVRDSELAKLPDGLLETIKVKYPVVVTRLIHLLGHRLLVGANLHGINNGKISDMGSRPSGSNFSTVAVLSISDDVPDAFSYELYYALTAIGSVALLTSDFVKKTLGAGALDRQSEYRLCHWLGIQEDKNKIVLYQCDKGFSAWTQRCIRQADCILIVGLGDQEPSVGEVEKQLQYLSIRTQKELVLLHKFDGPAPKNTVKWLNMRDWCSSNHHIRCPKRLFVKRSSLKLREYYENEMKNHQPSIFSDFSRLARFLTGTSIGLVLGGGGARGIAHVGMIKAINEAGLPIDMVGGVSIGAFMGALWCMENNLTTFIQKAQSWSNGMTSYWNQILDLTYPSTAMFTGSAFNKSIYDVFGEVQVEDLWLPYFTVTTDITNSCPRTHRHGSLWRYVRASMSLSGYLPPLCDPTDGHLLLDGGYVNNLPADIMHDVMGAETIMAIDVGSQDNTDLTNYGDTLNGWWLLWKRWNPFTEPVRVPNLPEIQSRLAYVCCEKQLEEVKSSDYCMYIRPPIDGFKTLQFKSFKEIMNVGYHHGKAVFSTMTLAKQRSIMNFLQKDRCRKLSILSNDSFFGDGQVSLGKQLRFINKSSRQTSFTDLAERIYSIPTMINRPEIEDISEDDMEYYSEPELRELDPETENIKDRKISNEV
ncbi:Neuropathy target esterase sws [Sarcoptes scabiei]|uniref:lysophospholipase n=1 Tax=Sarcoptes scabiei TaxID=52283 RepID=A0A834REG4_SARSC|nr:Neuropathy target esterase sws [Sarcoptes scabiei]